ncbi:hypothetical protein F183_A32900 [Bryobacterales bacterium F-183]|nr:hypothetical protein F183_A32900 [Bryobacterales bacterium F-183]
MAGYPEAEMSFLKGKLLWLLGGVVLLGVGGMFALPYLVDVNRYRPLIQDQIKTKLGRDVVLGPMDLQVFPLTVRVRDFSIAEDAKFATGKPFASAKELRVHLGLFALLSGNVEVSSLLLESPKVELVRNKAGVWNFASLGSGSSGGDSAGPTIARLAIADGTVGYLDEMEPKPVRTQYDHLDITLTDYAPGKKYGLEATVHLPGKDDPVIQWSGSGQDKSLSGKLSFERVTLASLRQFTAASALDDMDGALTGALNIAYGNAASAKGTVEVANLRVRKSQLDFPLKLEVDAAHDTARKRTEVQKLDIHIGGTKLAVTGTIENEIAKLKVATRQSPIAELLKLAATFGGGLDPGMQAKGSLSADVTVEGPVSKPAYNGAVDISDLEIRNKGWAEPVRAAAVKLTLSPAEIRSTPFQIEAAGAKLQGNFTLTAYTGENPQIAAAIRAADARVEGLLHVAQAFGAAAPDVTGTGLIDLDVSLTGPAKQPRYAGKARMEKASINLPGITKPVAVPQLDARFAEQGVWIDHLSANLAGTSLAGKMSIQNFDAPNVQFTLSMDKVDTTEMQKLFAPSSSNAQASKPGAFAKANGNGTLAIGSLLLNGIALTQVASKCTIDNGMLVLDPVTAGLYGGAIQGRITADLRTAVPQVTLQAKLASVDANSLVSAVTPLKQTVFGKFNADTSLRLNADGADTAKSLNGTMGLQLSDGKIAGVNYLNEVAKFAKFFGYNGTQGKMTDFVKLGGTLKFQNGVAQTDDLDMQINGARITGAGTVNLVSQMLDLRLGTTLDKALSDSVGGSKIGGFMTTALTNEKGQLLIPALLKGPFANPSVQPDAEQFAKLKLKGFANPANLGNTKETVQGVIDLFRKKKPEKQ